MLKTRQCRPAQRSYRVAESARSLLYTEVPIIVSREIFCNFRFPLAADWSLFRWVKWLRLVLVRRVTKWRCRTGSRGGVASRFPICPVDRSLPVNFTGQKTSDTTRAIAFRWRTNWSTFVIHCLVLTCDLECYITYLCSERHPQWRHTESFPSVKKQTKKTY